MRDPSAREAMATTDDSFPPTVAEPAVPLAPVAPAERFATLDVVRGFALLGIFLMNVEFFTRPLQDLVAAGIEPTLQGADWWADAAIYFFVQSKFWTLFSLLFGMGFAVMIERATRAGRPFWPTYLRRSLALLGIGLVHALLVWSGDILVSYAAGALLLLGARALRRAIVGRDGTPMSPRWLAGLGIASYAVVPMMALAGGALMSLLGGMMPAAATEAQAAQATAAHAAHEAVREAAVQAYAHGTWAQATAQRVIDFWTHALPGMVGFLPIVLGVFLLGMAILRSGVAEHPGAHLPALRRMRNWGLPLGFATMALSTSLGTSMATTDFGLDDGVQFATFMVAGLVLALAYAAALVLALQGRAGPWLQRWLAPAGQMALTNYLTQNLVGTWVFFGHGLGWWGQVGRFEQALFVFGVFAAQLVASRWWMANFRFGPAEWVWRALTYLKLPPMRREPAPA
jgi:uncharacterized protein